LKIFKDYRFHPKFTSDVQGGFKSLTYSNKIDPEEAMWSCQQQNCDFQHFANTGINGA
jgi:hypothetical protein